MTLTQIEPYIWIDQPEALCVLASRLEREHILAIDTESNSLYAYRERVCLVQISTTERDYLVDPLALHDLEPLRRIFADDKIEKVFHAAEYDLICLRRDFGFKFSNLFDTMLAARIAGWQRFGLGDILQAEFGILLDKRYQRADWGQRPLPKALKDYARMDSHYLIRLRDRLKQELIEKERWDLALEDFRRLCKFSEANSEPKDVDICRVNGGGELSPRKFTVLKMLCQYRDQLARQMDRPLFKVIGDKTLFAIAETCPTSMEELEKAPGMSRGQIKRYGKGLLSAIQTGLSAPLASVDRPPRPDPVFLKRLDALRAWRKETAKRMGVESDVVLPRDLLHALAETGPTDKEALAKLLTDVPWRLERFGEELLKVIRDGERKSSHHSLVKTS